MIQIITAGRVLLRPSKNQLQWIIEALLWHLGLAYFDRL